MSKRHSEKTLNHLVKEKASIANGLYLKLYIAKFTSDNSEIVKYIPLETIRDGEVLVSLLDKVVTRYDKFHEKHKYGYIYDFAGFTEEFGELFEEYGKHTLFHNGIESCVDFICIDNVYKPSNVLFAINNLSNLSNDLGYMHTYPCSFKFIQVIDDVEVQVNKLFTTLESVSYLADKIYNDLLVIIERNKIKTITGKKPKPMPVHNS